MRQPASGGNGGEGDRLLEVGDEAALTLPRFFCLGYSSLKRLWLDPLTQSLIRPELLRFLLQWSSWSGWMIHPCLRGRTIVDLDSWRSLRSLV